MAVYDSTTTGGPGDYERRIWVGPVLFLIRSGNGPVKQ